MIDEWFEVIELPISIEQFHALPINPAYKYEYFGGRAVLSPRPKIHTAVLPLSPRPAPGPVEVWKDDVFATRAFRESDWDALPGLFASAFWRVQPFCAMDDDRRRDAARRCLDKTRTGGDGPIVPGACVVAASVASDVPVAAALVTMQRGYREAEVGVPAPEGRLPHLTWIFVPPMLSRHGMGTALLDVAANALLDLGFAGLASTFLLGNESSTLWHWRNGFRLMESPSSPRRWKRRAEEMTGPDPLGS